MTELSAVKEDLKVRNEIIESYKKQIDNLNQSLSAVKEENKQLREALAICERAESTPLEPVKSEWISVKDKLPEFTEPLIGCNDDNTPKVIIENYHVTVLAFDPEIGIFKAKLTKFGWSEIGKSYINGTVNVTHWQPLPSPPIE
jgi:hypothetical protein